MNLDGHPDVVSVGDHGSPNFGADETGIMVWFGRGDGTFSKVQEGDFGYGGVAVGDVNGDGWPDVGWGCHHNYSSTDFGDQLIEVALGNGTGRGWQPWDDGLAQDPQFDWGMFGVDFADFDIDGDLDLVSNSFGADDGLHVYLNNGDGTWTRSWGFFGGNSAEHVFAGDINRDGYPDFVASHSGGTAYFGNGTGSFTLNDQGLPSAYEGLRGGLSAADLDGDGGMDIAFTLNGGVYAYIYDEGSETWLNWGEGLPSSGGYILTDLGDADGDGDPDLFAANSTSFTLFLNQGDGTWVQDTTVVFPGQDVSDVNALRVADLDHNGRVDVIVVYYRYTYIVYKNRLTLYLETSPASELRLVPVHPRGGEVFWAGSQTFIRWLSEVPAGSSTVRIELSTQGPSGPWELVVDELPNAGVYQWTVPDDSSDDCYLRFTVRSGSDSTVAVTQAPFTILGGSGAAREGRASRALVLGGRLLRVELPQPADLKVYDLAGSLVAEARGVKTWSWRAPKPGVYLVLAGKLRRAVLLR